MTKHLLVICHLSSVILLSACGFEPMYGERSSEGAVRPGKLLTGVEVEAKADDFTRKHLAYQFKNDLEDRLNPEGSHPTPPQYRLLTQIGYTETPTAVSPDGTVSHYNIILRADLILTRTSDDSPVYRGSVQHIGSYNNLTNAFYSTYASSQDTTRRTVTGLAEDVRLRLAAFFAQNPNPRALADAPPPEPERPIIPPSDTFLRRP